MSVIIHFDNVLPPSDASLPFIMTLDILKTLEIVFGFGLRLTVTIAPNEMRIA